MTPTLADVIDKAINEFLWDGGDRGQEIFSCQTVVMALPCNDYKNRVRAISFLELLGCDCNSGLFYEFQSGPKRQYARALWLTWAAMIAREEGL